MVDLKITKKIGDYKIIDSGFLIIYDNKEVTLTLTSLSPNKDIVIQLEFDDSDKELKLKTEIENENKLKLVIINPGMSCYTIDPMHLLNVDNSQIAFLFSLQRLGDNLKGWLFNYSFVTK